MSEADEDYAVGKGKPPRETRFKKGQSGNPNGRPKGAKNFTTELAEILTAPVSITENGRSRKVTSRMATLMRLRKKALEGDGRAMDRFIELSIRHAIEQEAASSERKLSATEDDILQRYIADQTGPSSPAAIDVDNEEDSDDSPS